MEEKYKARIFTYILGLLAAPEQEDTEEGVSGGQGVPLPGDHLGHPSFLGALQHPLVWLDLEASGLPHYLTLVDQQDTSQKNSPDKKTTGQDDQGVW